jgi:hypothetical protein
MANIRKQLKAALVGEQPLAFKQEIERLYSAVFKATGVIGGTVKANQTIINVETTMSGVDPANIQLFYQALRAVPLLAGCKMRVTAKGNKLGFEIICQGH